MEVLMRWFKVFLPFCFFMVYLAVWAQTNDSLQGWTDDQLKSEIFRLRRENQELRNQLQTTLAPIVKKEGKEVKYPEGTFIVDNFETQDRNWWVGCDQNNMGTTVSPNPYQRLEGGSPATPGYCAGLKGYLGPNEDPWTWATLQTPLVAQGGVTNLNSYTAIMFYAKGDGNPYVVKIERDAVKDYAQFEVHFTSSKDWTLVKIPLSDFNQPNWGAHLERDWKDVTNLSFSPELHEANFELRVDDIVFLK
jgi:hypothetical protein